MDSKRSMVTDASRKMYKAVLPRVTDLIDDMLALLSKTDKPNEVEVFICDAKDAFWQVPLHPAERRFYCAKLSRPDGRDSYLAYTRTAQGSRGAPLSWTVEFGLVCRCAAGTLRCEESSDTQRLQVYVDDPALVVSGPRPFRRQQVALLMLVWTILGVSLAIDKGQFGPHVDWIGVELSVHSSNSGGVMASILASRMDEIKVMADDIARNNVVGLKLLRTFTGKCQSVASLLFTWRPFIHMLYAAIYCLNGDAPPGCRWVRQIGIPLSWIQAFMAGVSGQLERFFTLDAYLRTGYSVVVTTDASPWGLGAVLEFDGKIAAWFSSPISPVDRCILSLDAEPSSSDQQVLEALALLVALREWASEWTNRRVQLSVRSDNVAALTLICKMQPHSDRMGIIARELALDISSSSLAPDEAVHIPGLANKAADVLSRLHQPAKAPAIPEYLSADLRWECMPRPRHWWRSVPTGQPGK